MSNTIISEPNDTVAIICKRHDNQNNTYIINLTDVSLGKILVDGTFVTEDGKKMLRPIDSFDDIDNNYIEEFYCDPISIDELMILYDTENVNLALMRYFKEIASKLSMALKTENEIRLYEQNYSAISPEISGDVTKRLGDGKTNSIVTDAKVKENPKKVEEPALKNTLINPLTEPIDIDDFIKFMNGKIIGNEDTIQDICTTIVMNLIAKNPKYVKNLLSIGPTGSGKSQSWKNISEYLSVPIVIFDCNTLSSAGYVGDSIEDYLKRIYNKSKSNLDLANKAIMVLDEIDKLGSNNSLDIKESAQDSLLKVIEGHAFDVEINKQTGKTVILDTTGMTIVGCGAFSTIFEKRRGETGLKTKTVGFNLASENKEIISATDPRMLAAVTDEELKEFGFKAEFIPRFHKRNVYRELDEDGLRLALTTSGNSALLQTIEEYNDEFNCEILYDDAFIDAIVAEAYKLKCGGRSLNRITADAFKYSDTAILAATKSGTDTAKRRVLKLTGDTIKNPRNFDLK